MYIYITTNDRTNTAHTIEKTKKQNKKTQKQQTIYIYIYICIHMYVYIYKTNHDRTNTVHTIDDTSTFACFITLQRTMRNSIFWNLGAPDRPFDM